MERHHGYLQNLFDIRRCVLGFGLLIGQASAVPANRLSVAPSQGTKDFQSISWVCDAYRCWYAPDYYAYYGYYVTAITPRTTITGLVLTAM